MLTTLVADYTAAYNEGRTLNDQRYDDLVTLYLAVLDKTEDSYNTLETADETYEDAVEVIIAAISSEFASYDTDVTGDLDDWGTDLLAEINARFDALDAAELQGLIDRGMSNTILRAATSAAAASCPTWARSG